MRTIRVTGKGQMRVHPDTTRLTLTMEGIHEVYADTLRSSSEKTEAVKNVLSSFGFERSNLKTLDFRIHAEYEDFRDKKGTCRRRFVGYRYCHLAKIEFDSDNERLGKILPALAKCSAKPEFRISCTVKDPEALKNALLGKAVTDAMEKAAVLAKAAGKTLGEIQSMDYSWGRIEFETGEVDTLALKECMPMDGSGCWNLDIEPDDIEAADTVTIVWEIA